MFEPRPLCCSSLTTAVGGTTDTNFVDSAHPTVARIIRKKENMCYIKEKWISFDRKEINKTYNLKERKNGAKFKKLLKDSDH